MNTTVSLSTRIRPRDADALRDTLNEYLFIKRVREGYADVKGEMHTKFKLHFGTHTPSLGGPYANGYTNPATLARITDRIIILLGGSVKFSARAPRLVFLDLGSAEGFAACYFSVACNVLTIGVEMHEPHYVACYHKVTAILHGDNPAAVIGRVAFIMGDAALLCFEGLHFVYFFNGAVFSQADLLTDVAYAEKYGLARLILSSTTMICFVSTALSPETLWAYIELGARDTNNSTWLQSGERYAGDGFVNPNGYELDVIELSSLKFCGGSKLSNPVFIWYRPDLVRNSDFPLGVRLEDQRLSTLCASMLNQTSGPVVNFETIPEAESMIVTRQAYNNN
jgi:hypothetical protein